MGAVGGALGAINGGNIAGLTNELANLGGLAPNILTDVLGGRLPLSGIDIGGFGALGGLDFDMALATTFMSTASAFLECDPPPKCDYSDTHTLGGGPQKKDDSKSNSVNMTNAMEKLDELSDNKRGSAFAAGKALNNRIKEGIESTGIPSDLPEGSFGISSAGREQALNNRINAASRITNIPSGEDLLPGSFAPTPKKKFNVPKKDTGLSFSEYRGISKRIEYVDPLVGEANPKFKTFEIGRPFVPPEIEKDYGRDEINLTRSFENSDSPLFKKNLLERINSRRTSLNKPPYLPLTSAQLKRGVKLKISDLDIDQTYDPLKNIDNPYGRPDPF